MKCAKCQIREAKSNSLYCEKCDSGFIKNIGSLKIAPSYLTFEEYLEKIIKNKNLIEKFLLLDDVLLTYRYYQESHEFDPILGPDFKSEHYKAEIEFKKSMNEIISGRLSILVDPGYLAIKFKEFRDILWKCENLFSEKYGATQRFSIEEPILILKKILRIRDLDVDPSFVDELCKFFDPGSATFILELYLELLGKKIDLDKFLKKFEKISSKSDYLLALLEYPVVLLKLWGHQKRAIDAWMMNGGRGIVEMATGTGKTAVGLYAIQKLCKDNRKLNVIVTCHSRAILEQWKRECTEKLGIRGSSGYEVAIDTKFVRIEFETIQKIIRSEEKHADLLIIDEVHHAIKGPEFREVFRKVKSNYFLGLSASMEEGNVFQILKALDTSIVFRYGLKEAINDGVLPEFDWFVHPVHLSPEEIEEFRNLTKDILAKLEMVKKDQKSWEFLKELELQITDEEDLELYDLINAIEKARYRKMEVPESLKALALSIIRRRWLIHRSLPRIEDAILLAKEYYDQGKKIIIFTMDIDTCNYIQEKLSGFSNIFVVHSKLRNPYEHIKRFKECKSGILIGAKMLEEGIDIPDAEVGINVAASKTRLQLIQRLGRILRKNKNKKPIFHHFVAIPTKEIFIDSEDTQWILDERAWVIDAALSLGCDVKVVEEGEIREIYREAENRIRRLYKKDTGLKFGALNLEEVILQFGEEGIYKLIEKLDKIDKELSDEDWLKLIRDCCQREGLKGSWWLLALFNRDPKKISAFLKDWLGQKF